MSQRSDTKHSVGYYFGMFALVIVIAGAIIQFAESLVLPLLIFAVITFVIADQSKNENWYLISGLLLFASLVALIIDKVVAPTELGRMTTTAFLIFFNTTFG